MKRYICLDDINVWDVCGHIQGCPQCDFDEGKGCMIHEWVNSLPTIDIVHCRECEYGEYRVDFDDYECHASGCGLVHDAEFYCADGIRKEGEE